MTRTRPPWSRWTLAFLGVVLLLTVLPHPGHADPRVASVEAAWEDSLAVLLPEVLDPITPSLRQTLRSGVPIVIDLEVRFTRTGFVTTEHVSVKVEYDVWTGWYRVHTPLSPFAIETFSTVELLFQRDLVLLFDEEVIDPEEDWFVKVRAGASMIEEHGAGSRSGVEDDLSGLSRLIFRLFGNDPAMGEWSDLVKLPRRDGS